MTDSAQLWRAARRGQFDALAALMDRWQSTDPIRHQKDLADWNKMIEMGLWTLGPNCKIRRTGRYTNLLLWFKWLVLRLEKRHGTRLTPHRTERRGEWVHEMTGQFLSHLKAVQKAQEDTRASGDPGSPE